MVGRGRREERCGAGQSLQQTPAPHPNKPVTGTELPCIVWHFGVRVHPALEKDGVRDRTPVQLQAVPSAGRSLPVVRPRTGLLLQGVQRAVEGREAARGAATLPAHGEGARDGPAPPASLPDPPGGTCARGGRRRQALRGGEPPTEPGAPAGSRASRRWAQRGPKMSPGRLWPWVNQVSATRARRMPVPPVISACIAAQPQVSSMG